ncbi:MAG: hypothetical protein ABW007_09685 [Chitinophagaceae bacterium]
MIHLFINYYNDVSEERQREINDAVSKNIGSGIGRIVLATENPDTNFYQFTDSPKVEIVLCGVRPTFAFLFDLVNSKVDDTALVIIANADIYFDDENLALLNNCMNADTCLALSRWDIDRNGQSWLFDREDSQDSWIFKGPIKAVTHCDFTMGSPGCDNAIAQRLEAGGYRIYNPSRSLRSFHLHQSNIRNYLASGDVPTVALPYRYISPCYMEDLPVVNWVTEIAGLAIQSNYSQYGEDAIIEHIFRHIGITNQFFVDLGAGAYGESTMSNTRKLKQDGWAGYGVDADRKGESWIIERFIKPDNILPLLNEQDTPAQFDFLNLDIDSCDFWVLQQLLKEYSPRCICTEFNGTLDPLVPLVLTYEEGYTWDETNKYGYSFAAGEKLLRAHGYRIIHNMHDQNIFAVKQELVKDLIFDVSAREVHYHPLNAAAVWERY